MECCQALILRKFGILSKFSIFPGRTAFLAKKRGKIRQKDVFKAWIEKRLRFLNTAL
jgi:hypothetical protein